MPLSPPPEAFALATDNIGGESCASSNGSAQWQGLECVPRDARWIEIETSNGKVHRAHYACDLSGEEQPPFEGFFVAVVGSKGQTLYFTELPGKPVRWREIAQNESRSAMDAGEKGGS